MEESGSRMIAKYKDCDTAKRTVEALSGSSFQIALYFAPSIHDDILERLQEHKSWTQECSRSRSQQSVGSSTGRRPPSPPPPIRQPHPPGDWGWGPPPPFGLPLPPFGLPFPSCPSRAAHIKAKPTVAATRRP